MTLNEYIGSLVGRRIAVCGLGISNRPLIRLLLEGGCSVTVCDRHDREALGGEADELERAGARLSLGEGYLDGLAADVVFRAPSLLPRQLEKAAAAGAVVTSEMEAFLGLCPCRVTAVTGSDGKTTTATLISELLREAGHRVWLGGNIGTPLLEHVPEMAPEDHVVVELSSFQLHSMSCRPHVAVITNLSPNHLDIHSSYDDYIDAKKNIFRNQGSDCLLVLNRDCELTRSLAAESQARVRFFSRRETVRDGAFYGAGMIYLARDWNPAAVAGGDEVGLRGVHNIENLMAAFCAVEDLVGRDVCRKVALDFKGVRHRLELIRELDGVRYYNDSIASSPSRAIAGMRSFTEPITLIAGGKDKGLPFDELGAEICRRAEKLILTGATADTIALAVRNSGIEPPEIYMEPDMASAVQRAQTVSAPGSVVLLSPGCTSFDRYKNFEERGDFFRRVVNGLLPAGGGKKHDLD